LKVRPLKFSGYFYPSRKVEIEELFDRFEKNIDTTIPDSKIITGIVPHAGIIYSGFTAFHFYKLLKNIKVERIVLIGPSHHHLFDGFILSDCDYWETPFGNIEIDKEFLKNLNTKKFIYNDNFHNDEHSLEVQTIFLSYILKNNFSIVPIIMSTQSLNNASHLVDLFSKIDLTNTLFIASSDLYHGNDYEEAIKTDKNTLKMIEKNNYRKFYDYVVEEESKGSSIACGYGPITTILLLNDLLKINDFILLHHITSADITNDYSGYTVGYSAFAGVKNEK